ncbi:MAG TPA: chemotaxis protein CheD [Bryobacteraceae bacterium]|nr:chemotaxis protein CheD [Bryobacteraceae bacterium]
MAQIIVGMADCRIADEPNDVLVTYALGSCIGLSVFDPVTHVGGLLHFMLPDSSIGSARGESRPFMFADTGIPLLLERVCQRGAVKRRLIVRAAGAAKMMDPNGVFDIGRRNHLAMRKILWKAGVLVHAEAIGGVTSRSVRLELATGRLLIREPAAAEYELPQTSPKQGGSPWHIAC